MRWKYPKNNEFPILRHPVLIEFESGDYDKRDLPNDSLKDWWKRNIKRWLDESPPASIEDEAARLYPFKKVNHELFIGCNDLAKYQQLAHITCAGMYTREIERLKAEAEQSLLLYNNQTATIFKLEAENSKMRNALEWYADAGNYLGDNGELATAWKQNENIKNKAAEAIKSPNV